MTQHDPMRVLSDDPMRPAPIADLAAAVMDLTKAIRRLQERVRKLEEGGDAA